MFSAKLCALPNAATSHPKWLTQPDLVLSFEQQPEVMNAPTEARSGEETNQIDLLNAVMDFTEEEEAMDKEVVDSSSLEEEEVKLKVQCPGFPVKALCVTHP